jgi:hypothetical protein
LRFCWRIADGIGDISISMEVTIDSERCISGSNWDAISSNKEGMLGNASLYILLNQTPVYYSLNSSDEISYFFDFLFRSYRAFRRFQLKD